MSRWALTIGLATGAACGVHIEGPPAAIDGATQLPPIDAAIDAPPDARPCTGGDTNMMSGTSCYLLFTTPRDWAAANAQCQAIGTHLAILDTATKHADAKMLAGALNTWIGLSDSATEMVFAWVDPAVPFAFTAWDPSEPNNAGGSYEEDCVVIAGARGGDWDDRPCSPSVPGAPATAGSYAYICQF